MVRHLISLRDLSAEEMDRIIDFAVKIKQFPGMFSSALRNKTMLMFFEKPSLRTHISFEVAMTQLGGHAIYYNIQNSPMGKKESVSDTVKTASRYVDIMIARLFSHADIEEMARSSSVPVINALTNFSHPCQILGDLLTIKEKKGLFKNLKLAYVGDCNNNVTHSLLYGCSKVGIDISVACPKGKDYEPQELVVKESKTFAKNSKVIITNDPVEAVKNADVVYTDSWMSYHVPDSEKEARVKIFKPYQVTEELLSHAKKNVLFMHCLPAARGMEVTDEVIDSSYSIVFDQAENRLHIQKAIILFLLGFDIF